LGQAKDLWHGINLELILSLSSVLLAFLVYKEVAFLSKVMPLSRILGSDYFDVILKKHFSFALRVTRTFQNGSLRFYFLTILISALALVLWQWPHDFVMTWAIEYSLLWSIVGALLILKLFALVYLIKTENPLMAVLSLGLVGYAVAGLFALYGAPDLAMTQFSVETLSVFLFVFVLKDVPRFKERSETKQFGFDMLISLFSGVFIFALSWAAVQTSAPSRLREYFSEMSFVEAHGRNVVNVILVDFRAFDTMGEIAVLGIAAIGVVALLKIGKGQA
jgi:multicomponent Na+:H+ antiporter subunit A